MRLTEGVRLQLLAQNEGFEATTHYDSRNSALDQALSDRGWTAPHP
jgi:hypothetical protein